LVVVFKGRLEVFFLVAADQSIINGLSKRHMIHTAYVLVVRKYCILIFLDMNSVNKRVESLL
jgi:predicted Co/Zn/Cd cation transporter (cation efflux family)